LGASVFLALALLSSPVTAAVVPLSLDNNGVVITGDDQIVDVDFVSNGSGGWLVNVGNGLNFEEFYANFSQPVGAGDINISTAGWSLVTAGGGGGTAGNFGPFSIKIDGPVAGGTAALQFELTVAGLFEPNSKGNTFAVKISSQQGGNAGGFVSHGSVSQVPLPAAVWLFLSALAGLAVLSRRRTAAQA
jgi:hypothetical protein